MYFASSKIRISPIHFAMPLLRNQIKYLQSLQQKKFRQKYNKFIVEGDKMIKELLDQSLFQVDNLFATDSWVKTNRVHISLPDDRLFKVSLTELNRISSLKTPNQVLAVIDIPTPKIDFQAISSGLHLYLDDIRDPGNLGTILRIADWFGFSFVFRSPNSVECYNPKVVQASMGAFLRVSSPEYTLQELSEKTVDLPIFGAGMNGVNIFNMEKPKKGIIIIGNEGKGISDENKLLIDTNIGIPKDPNGQAESLNAAVATGIICAAIKNGK